MSEEHIDHAELAGNSNSQDSIDQHMLQHHDQAIIMGTALTTQSPQLVMQPRQDKIDTCMEAGEAEVHNEDLS